MTRTCRHVLAAALAMALVGCASTETIRSVENAQAIDTANLAFNPDGLIGYLGVNAKAVNERVVAQSVAPGSPAASAGVQPGDQLLSIGEQRVRDADDVRHAVQAHAPGDHVVVTVRRKGEKLELPVVLGAVSKPLKLQTPTASIGIRLGSGAELDGAPVAALTIDGPAQKAGVKVNDLVLKIDGSPINDGTMLTESLVPHKPGDVVTLHIRRGEEEKDIPVTLSQSRGTISPFTNQAPRTIFKKPVYKLAIIGIEYPDVKHSDKIKNEDWAESLFSTGTYHDKTNATGQKVYGSLNDFYHELSNGKLKVEGKVFGWVKVSKNRADYSQGSGTSNKAAVMTEAMDLLLKRDGNDALKGFDGVFFIYAGERYKAVRGGVYWPHRSTLLHKNVNWSYLIIPEGGEKKMTDISLMAHEFGHMLGLPDQYARPEMPGSEGAGNWCLMSGQLPNGRPQHMCAWCKEQMGWLKPTVIDPTVAQRLALRPVEKTSNQCFKVLLRRDGSEYVLLEYRKKQDFDTGLPGEGLLIWRVTAGKPLLEESHGIEGPPGPMVYRTSIPYPSPSNNAYTPYTTPSSRATLGGGLPCFITNIRQLADGRIAFEVGSEYD